MYDSIDVPVLQVLDYFSGNLVYFLNSTVKLATIMAGIGVLWECIQVAFGALEIRKMIVGFLTKWVVFILILNVYSGATTRFREFCIEAGRGASGKALTELTNDLKDYMIRLKKIIETDERDMEKKVRQLTELTNQKSELLKNWNQYDENELTEAGFSLFNTQKELDKLKAEKESKEQNPFGMVKTLKAIENVLVAVKGDDNVVMTDRYALDLALYNKDKKDTGLISPAAMMRLSLLAAKIMWEREWYGGWETDENGNSVSTGGGITQEWEANDKAGFFSRMTEGLDITKFPVKRLGDLVFLFVAVLFMAMGCAVSLIQYVTCIVEYTIMVPVAAILLPFMFFDGLKDMTHKILPALLAQGMKLLLCTMCMMFNAYIYLYTAMNMISSGSPMDIEKLGYIIFISLLSLAVISNGPKLAMSLMTGSPQLSMGEFVQAAAAGGAALAFGGHAAHTAAGAAGAVNRHAPGAMRAGLNQMGDMAAMGGAFKNSWDKGVADGVSGAGGKTKLTGVALAEALKAKGWRAKTRFAGNLDDWIRGDKPTPKYMRGGGGGDAAAGEASGKGDNIASIRDKRDDVTFSRQEKDYTEFLKDAYRNPRGKQQTKTGGGDGTGSTAAAGSTGGTDNMT